jgi:proton-translocating NADH-quinone oxidoreductase chain N
MAVLLIIVPLILLMVLNLPFAWFKRWIGFWAMLVLALIQIAVLIMPSLGFFGVEQNALSKLLNIPASFDALTYTMLLSIAIVLIATMFVCYSRVKDAETRFNVMSIIFLSVVGMNGVVMVRDIFTMYVFLEVTAIASFILIAFLRSHEGFEGAFKYILFSTIATMMMLVSIAIMLMFAGDTTFASIAAVFNSHQNNPLLLFSVALFISGVMIKSGLVPFHGWLPDAYSAAPNSVSVLLAGIVTKTVGIYPLIRILYSVVGLDGPIRGILLFIGALTAVVAALLAIAQSDLKRMFSYSSISQMGYIVMAVGSGTVLGIAAAVFHIFNHSIFKSLLFVNAEAIESKTNSRNIDMLGGLGAKMPVTATTTALASLSVAGIPPLSGFWSKLLIIIALWSSGNIAYAVIAVLTSLLTLTYMLMLQRKVFFGNPDKAMENVKEAEISILIPAVILTVIMLIVSLAFPLLIGSFIIPVNGL